MVDVADYFNLHITTTHAAIAYLDRLQPNEKYTRFEWQMMAICCLIISSKYNEMEEHVPALPKLEEITQQTLSNECVLNYELWALKRMGWKLNGMFVKLNFAYYYVSIVLYVNTLLVFSVAARTPMAFMDSFFLLIRDLPENIQMSDDLSCFTSQEFELSAEALCTKCLFEHVFKPLPASAIATAILYHLRDELGCHPVWSCNLTRITGHDAFTSKSVHKVLELLSLVSTPNNSVDNTEDAAGTPLEPHSTDSSSDDSIDKEEGEQAQYLSPEINRLVAQLDDKLQISPVSIAAFDI
jgi:hypothetical protein